MQIILSEVEKESIGIINRCLEEIQNVVNLLGGILHGSPGDRFDTLANFDKIGGNENKRIITAWEQALTDFSQISRTLAEVKELEFKRREQ